MNLMGYQLFNTSFSKNNRFALSALLLVFFVVYSISPLSCTYTAKKIVGKMCGANEMFYSGQNLNILLLEVICAKVDAKNSDRQDAPVRVLIRKSRAILSEDVNSSFALLGYAALSEDITSFFDSLLSRLPASAEKQESIWELNPLHSGPSPPAG